MTYRLAALLLASILVGCSTSGVAIPIGSERYSPTEPGSVEILTTAPDRPFVEVALVDGTAATDDYFTEARTQAAALAVMKKKAAEMGAHAIIMDETDYKQTRPYGGMWEKLRLRGKAIRYLPVP